MLRRDFLKNSALVAATSVIYSPLYAKSVYENTKQNRVAIVSESAKETGYISALEKGNKVDSIIILGLDNLENLRTLASVVENNKGSLFYGLLSPSDHALLSQIAMSKSALFISETAHTPSTIGVHHTENSFAMMSVKKVFDQFASINTQRYGIALSSYHTISSHSMATIEKQTNFISNHTAKNAFVSFVLKA